MVRATTSIRLGSAVLRRAEVAAEKVAEFGGFVFVHGEYNRGIPASLKNALSRQAVHIVRGEFLDLALGKKSFADFPHLAHPRT